MQAVSTLVKVSLPRYLSDLPLPDTLGGWFSLGLGDWFRLIPVGAAIGGLSYLGLQGLASAPVVGPVVKVNQNEQIGLHE